MRDLSYRNIWISLGTVMPFAAVGFFLLRHSQEVKEAFGLVMVVIVVLVLHVLDRRELRRRGQD